MIEIEAKVWLDAKGKDYRALLEKLKKKYIFIAELEKTDWYFSKADKKDVFRLRQEGAIYIVSYKERALSGAVEHNQEIEFHIDDKDTFIQFSKKLGYEISFYKHKKTYQFIYNSYTLELSFIENLGWFLEIEKLCSEAVNFPDEQKLLLAQFQELGFLESDLEPRKYLQLLSERP